MALFLLVDIDPRSQWDVLGGRTHGEGRALECGVTWWFLKMLFVDQIVVHIPPDKCITLTSLTSDWVSQ